MRVHIQIHVHVHIYLYIYIYAYAHMCQADRPLLHPIVCTPAGQPVTMGMTAQYTGTFIVLSFAPSAAFVWHCERGRITCERNSVRHSVFFKRWAGQFVIWRFIYRGFFQFRGQFCGDFLSLFGVILITFGVPGPRGPPRDPFWQHGRKREEQKLDF